MSKRILRNRLFSKRLKIKQNTDYSHSQRPHSFWYVLFSGWGELFSKWENWCPSQCGPKADFQSVLRTLESLFTTFCFVLCKTSQNVAFRIYLHEVNSNFMSTAIFDAKRCASFFLRYHLMKTLTAVKINEAVGRRVWKVSKIRYVILNE